MTKIDSFDLELKEGLQTPCLPKSAVIRALCGVDTWNSQTIRCTYEHQGDEPEQRYYMLLADRYQHSGKEKLTFVGSVVLNRSAYLVYEVEPTAETFSEGNVTSVAYNPYNEASVAYVSNASNAVTSTDLF